MRVLRISVAVVVFIALVSLAQAQQAAQAALPVPSVKVGEMAPDFTLKDQSGKPVSLKDFRGKQNVALAFYVFAFSPN
jgi:cytochrome oxidase Cu insertion factor (SCO1/SenC/PrrC family)